MHYVSLRLTKPNNPLRSTLEPHDLVFKLLSICDRKSTMRIPLICVSIFLFFFLSACDMNESSSAAEVSVVNENLPEYEGTYLKLRNGSLIRLKAIAPDYSSHPLSIVHGTIVDPRMHYPYMKLISLPVIRTSALEGIITYYTAKDLNMIGLLGSGFTSERYGSPFLDDIDIKTYGFTRANMRAKPIRQHITFFPNDGYFSDAKIEYEGESFYAIGRYIRVNDDYFPILTVRGIEATLDSFSVLSAGGVLAEYISAGHFKKEAVDKKWLSFTNLLAKNAQTYQEGISVCDSLSRLGHTGGSVWFYDQHVAKHIKSEIRDAIRDAFRRGEGFQYKSAQDSDT